MAMKEIFDMNVNAGNALSLDGRVDTIVRVIFVRLKYLRVLRLVLFS